MLHLIVKINKRNTIVGQNTQEVEDLLEVQVSHQYGQQPATPSPKQCARNALAHYLPLFKLLDTTATGRIPTHEFALFPT